ncbi:hypothetical protein NM688_g8246 [Phlebia brevispora]|uniref:Uncharacterized protein n=1 Tax=Phlebia brevispora TaxID=194682 RepID=A0ACC1RVF0_9APHY|nr:hypothetical protein NM688_g8246 [Phlebia brevispora]
MFLPYRSLHVAGWLDTSAGSCDMIRAHDFREHLFPSLPQGIDPAQIVEKLKTPADGEPAVLTPDEEWISMKSLKDPGQLTRENVYRALTEVVDAIMKAVRESRPSISLHYNSAGLRTSEQRAKQQDYLPDICLTSGSKQASGWTDIQTFGELHVGDTTRKDSQDTCANVLNSINRCMASDPRRRFLHAFAMEKTSMRFFYCDRRHLIASDAIDLNNLKASRRLDVFVHFFLSMIYADPTARGFDPTIVLVDGSQQYDITVHCRNGGTRVYRTLEVLARPQPTQLGSRPVWKVIEIKDGKAAGKPVVLKDMWSRHGWPLEGDTLQEVRTANRPAGYRSVDSSFPSVECYGYVLLDPKRGKVDCLYNRFFDYYWGMRLGYTRAETALVHHRIVYTEVCKALKDEISLKIIFRSLAQVSLALRDLHVAGWVHRDLSTGNVLLTANGDTLLADLELAKKMHDGSKEGKVGTLPFIAIEAELQEYIHTDDCEEYPELMRKYPDEQAKFNEYLEEIRSNEAKKCTTSAQDSGFQEEYSYFRYNALHDVESLWWMAVYFILKREIVDESAVDDQTLVVSSAAQQSYSVAVFHGDDIPFKAHTLFHDEGFTKTMKTIPDRWSAVVERLNVLRRELVKRYVLQETDVAAIDHTCADGLHELFKSTFEEIAAMKDLQGMVVRRFMHVAVDDVVEKRDDGDEESAEEEGDLDEDSEDHAEHDDDGAENNEEEIDADDDANEYVQAEDNEKDDEEPLRATGPNDTSMPSSQIMKRPRSESTGTDDSSYCPKRGKLEG